MVQSSAGELRAALDRIAAYERGLQKTWMTRVLQSIGPTRAFGAVYRRLGPMVDPWLFRKTGGRIATKLYGFPTLLLVTTGARTGHRRTSPLFYARDGDAFVIVGTNFGTEHHPAWTGNLLKTPEAEIIVGSDSIAVTAQLADDKAFARIWPKLRAIYDGFDVYLARLTHRQPRMFLLHPIAR